MIHRTTALYAPPVQLALAVLLVAEVKVHLAVVVVVVVAGTTKVLPNQLEEVTLVILDPSFHVYPTVPPPNVHQHAPSMKRDTVITILT
jgi:hypothetical protein